SAGQVSEWLEGLAPPAPPARARGVAGVGAKKGGGPPRGGEGAGAPPGAGAGGRAEIETKEARRPPSGEMRAVLPPVPGPSDDTDEDGEIVEPSPASQPTTGSPVSSAMPS